MTNELQETKRSTPTKEEKKKLRAEILLTEVKDEWKVRLLRERIMKTRNVFDMGYFFDHLTRIGSFIDEQVTEHYFGTETEAKKFIKDVADELIAKNYEVEAKQIEVKTKNLLE